jgi:hypothetical protein
MSTILELAERKLGAKPSLELEREVFTELFHAAEKGLLSHTEYVPWIRARYMPKLATVMRQYEDGKLFPSQTATFDAWLRMSEEQHAIEVERAEYAISCIMLTHSDSDKDCRKLMRFIEKRVKWPSLRSRREILEDRKVMDEVCTAWGDSNKRNDWMWRP